MLFRRSCSMNQSSLTQSDIYNGIVFTAGAVYPAAVRSCPEKEDSEEKYDIGVDCKCTNN